MEYKKKEVYRVKGYWWGGGVDGVEGGEKLVEGN